MSTLVLAESFLTKPFFNGILQMWQIFAIILLIILIIVWVMYRRKQM